MGIGKYIEKIRKLEECCAENRISKIEGKFEVIQALEPMTKRGSPLQLTEHCEKVLADSGFKSLIDANSDEIIEYLSECITDTKYDVQECAERACKSLLEIFCLPNDVAYNGLPAQAEHEHRRIAHYKPLIFEIKNWLYENGYKIHHLVEAGTVYARDKAIPLIFNDVTV